MITLDDEASADRIADDVPAWFAEATSMPWETVPLVHDGAELELLCWGDPAKPGLLLLHGNRGHAHWWSPLAALLSARFRVAALSYSGSGGSAWRDSYSMNGYAEEAFAATHAAGMHHGGAPPVLVGHSFGGGPVLLAAERYGGALAGVIIADTYLAGGQEKLPYFVARAHRVYPTLQAALGHFRLAPAQAVSNQFYVDWIARHALREVSAAEPGGPGWTWRFDPYMWSRLTFDDKWRAATQTKCPMAVVYAEHSNVVEADVVAALRQHMPAATQFEMIKDAAHHLMIDQPLAVAEAIGRIASAWQHGPEF